MITFPKDFLWGAAASSYQVEGDNSYCDWWEWEKRAGKQPSGKACRHYDLYNEDFKLAQSLQHNCHRLSIEWSRIEPEEGVFNEKELRHYQEVISSLRSLRIEPVVTLHHFTNPLWFSKIGGWLHKDASIYFLRYVEKVAQAIGRDVKYWLTINEPLVYAYHSYLLGTWPPQEKSFLKAKKVIDAFAVSHIKAYRFIHAFYKKNQWPSPLVSIAENMQAFRICSPTIRNRIALYIRDTFYNYSFLKRLIAQKSLDYIGVNYYTRQLIEIKRWGIKNLFLDVCQQGHYPLEKNTLGWDIYPEGLFSLLVKLKEYRLPILITENGICTENDAQRWEYIRQHLIHIHRAMEKGVKVTGYIYWSLIDNFEWDKGFTPRFGIVEVNYQTYQRIPRESAKRFAAVCQTGTIE